MTGSSARNKAAGAARAKGRIRRSNEESILRAAEEVFARAGFDGARVADIAARARIPQANLHYYFRTKRTLYRAVLENILGLWLAETDIIRTESEPALALEHYVRAKMRFSRRFPNASKVFANEVIHGAREIGPFLRKELFALVEAKTRVIDGWIRAGRMAPLDPRHLFFMIWATTQTYADFEAQVRAVLGARALGERHFAHATDEVVGHVLRSCGLAPRSPCAPSFPRKRESIAGPTSRIKDGPPLSRG